MNKKLFFLPSYCNLMYGLNTSFKFSLKISELSRLTQEISLDAGSPYLTFHTQVCKLLLLRTVKSSLCIVALLKTSLFVAVCSVI